MLFAWKQAFEPFRSNPQYVSSVSWCILMRLQVTLSGPGSIEALDHWHNDSIMKAYWQPIDHIMTGEPVKPWQQRGCGPLAQWQHCIRWGRRALRSPCSCSLFLLVAPAPCSCSLLPSPCSLLLAPCSLLYAPCYLSTCSLFTCSCTCSCSDMEGMEGGKLQLFRGTKEEGQQLLRWQIVGIYCIQY